ncbi:MAG: hypothetical protein HY922_02030, partial [Elusimicrobia bacterium]|nr:hypothetical protein [Elusimicrobiota bacterium]
MMKRLAAIAAAVAVLGAGAVCAQEAPKMKILSFTGQIQIRTADGSVIGVVPGAAIPDIPPGAQIQVLTGNAVFQSGDTVVKAAAGDSFSYGAAATAAGAPAQVQIAALGDKTKLSVSVGKTEAVMRNGDAISVTASAGKGPAQLQVTSGQVSMTTGGKTETLAKGQSMSVETAAQPAVPATPAKPGVAHAVPATPATPATATETAPEEVMPVVEAPP